MVMEADFQGGPTFLLFCFAPIFPFSFLKMPYYPYFFTVRCHLRVKNPEFFSRLLRWLRFIIRFSKEQTAKHLKFKFLTKNVSLFC